MWIRPSKTKKDKIQILCFSDKMLTQSFYICLQDLRSSTEDKFWIPRITAQLETLPQKNTHNTNWRGEMLSPTNIFFPLFCLCSPATYAESQPMHKSDAVSWSRSLDTVSWDGLDCKSSFLPSSDSPWNRSRMGKEKFMSDFLQILDQHNTVAQNPFANAAVLFFLFQLSSKSSEVLNTLISLCGEISILRGLQIPRDSAMANLTQCRQQPSFTQEVGPEGYSNQLF